MYSRVICYSCTYWTMERRNGKVWKHELRTPSKGIFFNMSQMYFHPYIRSVYYWKFHWFGHFLPAGLQLLHYWQSILARWHEWRRQLLLRKTAIIFKSDVFWDHGRDERIYIVYQWPLSHYFHARTMDAWCTKSYPKPKIQQTKVAVTKI